jgi:hypothetical protein
MGVGDAKFKLLDCGQYFECLYVQPLGGSAVSKAIHSRQGAAVDRLTTQPTCLRWWCLQWYPANHWSPHDYLHLHRTGEPDLARYRVRRWLSCHHRSKADWQFYFFHSDRQLDSFPLDILHFSLSDAAHVIPDTPQRRTWSGNTCGGPPPTTVTSRGGPERSGPRTRLSAPPPSPATPAIPGNPESLQRDCAASSLSSREPSLNSTRLMSNTILVKPSVWIRI